MGFVRWITGRTLVRLVSGKPGDLAEFFDMARERGEKRVDVVFDGNMRVAIPVVLEGGGGFKVGALRYRTDSLKYVEPIDNKRPSEEVLDCLKKQYGRHADLYGGFDMNVLI